jgi:hypothetical protein
VTLSLNVELEGSVVGQNAVIGDNCEVYQSLLGADVTLEQPVQATSAGAEDDENQPEKREWFNERVSATGFEDPRSEKERQAEMIDAEVSGENGLWKEIMEERAAAAKEEEEEDNEEAGGDEFVKSIRGLLREAEQRLANSGDLGKEGFVLELKSARMAMVKTVKDLVKELAQMLMDKVVAAAANGEKLLAKNGPVQVWLPVLKEFRVVGSHNEGMAAIDCIYEACKQSPHLGEPKFASIMGFLSNEEVIEDDAAVKWYGDAESRLIEQKNFIEGEHVKKWIEFVKSNDDDDDDDDDDSDDSDDSD